MVSRVFFRSKRVEDRLFREAVAAGHTSEDLAKSILSTMDSITNKKILMAQEQTSETPNVRLVAKYGDIISNLTNTTRDLVVKLGADNEHAEQIMNGVVNGDVDKVKFELLGLLKKRNPEVYNKRYAQFAEYMAQKQK